MKRKSLVFSLAFLLIGCGIKNTNIIVEDETKEKGETLQEQVIDLQEQEVNDLIEQREKYEDNFKRPISEETREEGYISEIEIIKMSEDERWEFFEKYSPLTGMILRKEEDRIQNTFFPVGRKEVDMTVRYNNWEFLMVNGDANDLLYDEKKYIWENVCFYQEYLFSYECGDVYVVWYPELNVSEIMDQEGSTEKRLHPAVVGIFFVTEEEIINIRNFNTDNGPICLYELDEKNMLSMEHGFPVCDVNPWEPIEWEAGWRITIQQDNDYVVTDIKMDNDYYETYVWRNGVGLVGYQYGKYVGGDQHDFFTDEHILENYLHRGWE